MGLQSNMDKDLNEAFHKLDHDKSGHISRNKTVIELSNLIAKQGRGVFVPQKDF